MAARKAGPLAGVRVLELGGIGPGPFASMMLADMGATVIRIVRGAGWSSRNPILNRGRVTVEVDLKDPSGVAAVRRLAEHSDVVVEGFRPGVAERLGLGPKELHDINPKLVYGRMTGWGQDGPWAQAPGHDINYLSLTGALHAIGPKGGDPVPPLNLVADFGGGGMLLAYGIACALVSAAATGSGQVVDAAMVDGASLLMAMAYGHYADGSMVDERGSNMLDGAAPFYRTYRCADDRHMAVGCVEDQFYREFLQILGLDGDELFADQFDRDAWPQQSERIAGLFASRPRTEWEAVFADTEACTTPVLAMREAAAHPHVSARRTFAALDGIVQPMPAPRFDATPPGVPEPPTADPSSVAEALRMFGISQDGRSDPLVDSVLTAPRSPR
ncbi:MULTISPECIES: CaiB/BaiF CoA transferase family protein [Rhodococcus]|uniref:CoA transferase n=1 Tax=Rhodococcus pseudokoreensis TaxID=2811421 RepID=A0A974W258_9NOCA|nr:MULTISPECIES: CaiB/BaiF CoA-transferase family protein [Rhodococcus]MBV6760725.1 CoA transferase [Rhodococcus opacus]QSE89858.1 CoA transferase [Rhodococcus pseudokoreensis]